MCVCRTLLWSPTWLDSLSFVVVPINTLALCVAIRKLHNNNNKSKKLHLQLGITVA